MYADSNFNSWTNELKLGCMSLKLRTFMKIKQTDKLYALRSKLRVRGFTLIEILIFTAIVSVFFVVAAAVSAFSLQVMRTNENKIYATHYAEEAIEWLRNEKETTGWTTFSTRTGTWCLNSTLTNLASSTNTVCPVSGATAYQLGSTDFNRHFNRDAVLTSVAGNISANIIVSWKDVGGNTLSVPVNTIFAQIE